MNLCNCHTHSSKNPTWEIFSTSPVKFVDTVHSVGVHPWNSGEKAVVELIQSMHAFINKNTVAIGEIGLDRLKGPDFDIQLKIFFQQIEISEKVELPVILHCVKSWNEIAAAKRKINPKQTWIFHGFSKANLMREVLKENVVISIGSAILSNLKLQNALNFIPNDSLLLETDESEIPIHEIYQKVAQLKGITLVSLQKIIEQNCKRIFPKWQIG